MTWHRTTLARAFFAEACAEANASTAAANALRRYFAGELEALDSINIWAISGGSQSNGLQQVAMDTFWYIDPEKGLDGVWDNSLAADKPAYNADFTEMTVKLRKGIYWSDGVEFTAADVVHTVESQIKNPGMRWSAVFGLNVARVSAPDPYTVVFKLKKPNSRFHAVFTVRWNAAWIMPKHVFENVADPRQFDFNKPVSLGAYVLKSVDPDGKWYVWQLRDDWQRTTSPRRGPIAGLANPRYSIVSGFAKSRV